jgi:hypothetical protein
MTAVRQGQPIVGSVTGGLVGWDGTQWTHGILIVLRGTGSPEGVKTAAIGTLYINQSGGAGTTLYVKEAGAGNTGWAAK